MTTAAQRYAAVYDAALAAGRFSDHAAPGDHWADLAELFRLDPRRPRDANLSAVADYLRPTDRLLDVGGGAGRVSLALADCVAEVILIEPSAGMRAQFAAARDAAGITNTRLSPDWWLDSTETGEVIHLSDVTYFVRDIVPFIAKLHAAASRRVMLTVWRPTPGDMGAAVRRIIRGENPPYWPGLPELAAVLWEMGLLPEIRPLPDPPWWLTDEERNLSESDAVEFALRWLATEDDEAGADDGADAADGAGVDNADRAAVSANLDRLFDRTDGGLTPRWLSRPRAVLLTWATGGAAIG